MSQLPIAKIKRIAKVDDDFHNMTVESALALTFACEEFVKKLAVYLHQQAVLAGRKTIQKKDFDECIRSTGWLQFADGALDWDLVEFGEQTDDGVEEIASKSLPVIEISEGDAPGDGEGSPDSTIEAVGDPGGDEVQLGEI